MTDEKTDSVNRPVAIWEAVVKEVWVGKSSPLRVQDGVDSDGFY